MEYQTIQIPIAVNGLNKDLQPTQIPSASPNMKNMYVKNWGVHKRLGYIKKGLNLPLTGIGMELIQYIDARGNVHQIALTNTCAFLYDFSYDQWLNIMPSVQLQDCEDKTDWTAGTNVTLSDSALCVEGSKALKMTANDDIAVDAKIAYDTVAVNLDDYGAIAHISFWYYASKADVAIAIKVIDDDTDAATAISIINSPKAETWYHCCIEVDLSDLDTANTTIEIYTKTALSADDYIIIDDIRATSAFTGSDSNRFSHAVVHDANKFNDNGGSALCISNNIDYIHYYEGGDGSGRFVSLDLSSVFNSCKEIIEFWNHFFVMNYNDGNKNIRSLLYSDLGDIEDYASGTSGSNVLTDTIGQLLRAKKLSSDMIIYSSNTITTCRYLGQTVLFIFPTLVYETGLFAEKALWDFVNIHFFLGTDQKIYGYTGGTQLIQIGNAIEDSLFSELDASKKNQISFGLDIGKHKLHIAFPINSTTYANRCYTYNYKQQNKTWEYHEFADTIRDFSLFDNKISWYCDDDDLVNDYCDELSFYCDDSFTQEGYPVASFLSDDGYIFRVFDSTGKDDDSDIECIYETMDITVDNEEHYFRTAWLSFNGMSTFEGALVDVEYSTDSGDNWNTIKLNQSISNGEKDVWTQHRLPFDASARRIRFRFTQNSDKDFQLRAMHMKYLLEEDR